MVDEETKKEWDEAIAKYGFRQFMASALHEFLVPSNAINVILTYLTSVDDKDELKSIRLSHLKGEQLEVVIKDCLAQSERLNKMLWDVYRYVNDELRSERNSHRQVDKDA